MNNEMKNELVVTNTSTNEIVLYQPNETIQLEVRLQDETVWLNQQQIYVRHSLSKLHSGASSSRSYVRKMLNILHFARNIFKIVKHASFNH